MTEPVFPVRVVAIHYEAADIVSFFLERPDRSPLWPVEPGSHVDVHLPNGMMRSYSLSNHDGRSERYRLTVARDLNSKGGSTFLHDSIRAGQMVEISAPRNNFPLFEAANLTVMVAGGIGVTPFLPMMERLNALGRKWRIHYCVRTRERAALLGEIEKLAEAGLGELVANYDEEPGGAMLDLKGVASTLGVSDHIYCCGPIGMLDAFRKACSAQGIEDDRVHFEYFSSATESATDGGYDIILDASKRTVRVCEGQTMLQALLDAGLNIPYSCEEGVCGACETRVLAGTPDHRDMILSDRERAENRTMMVCCSGSKSPTITLDL